MKKILVDNFETLIIKGLLVFLREEAAISKMIINSIFFQIIFTSSLSFYIIFVLFSSCAL